MRIQDVATLKTGAVLSRLPKIETGGYLYCVLSLRNIDDDTGMIESQSCAPMRFVEKISDEFLTQKGDVILRLSAPYTAVYISDDSDVGLLIPSHFAIIHAVGVDPKYLYAMLDSDEIRKQLFIEGSMSTTLATISVKSISECKIPRISIQKQELIGQYHLEAKKELRLLLRLLAEKRKLNRIQYTKLIRKIDKGELV